MDEVFVYDIMNRETGETEHYVCCVSPDAAAKGLPGEAIMGKLVDGPDHFDPGHFAPNHRFAEFLHDVIARHTGACPGLVAEAERQQNGSVAIIDLRTPTPGEHVPPEDIIGIVEVKRGAVLGYTANPNYRVFTADGLMKLDPWFRAKLLEELGNV